MLVGGQSGNDTVYVTGKNSSDVGHGFPGTESHLVLTQVHRLAAKLLYTNLEAGTGAKRGLFKKQRHISFGERLCWASAFHFLGSADDFQCLIRTKVCNGKKIPLAWHGGVHDISNQVGVQVKQALAPPTIRSNTLQLQGRAEKRQVANPKLALSHNIGGHPTACGIAILGSA